MSFSRYDAGKQLLAGKSSFSFRMVCVKFFLLVIPLSEIKIKICLKTACKSVLFDPENAWEKKLSTSPECMYTHTCVRPSCQNHAQSGHSIRLLQRYSTINTQAFFEYNESCILVGL